MTVNAFATGLDHPRWLYVSVSAKENPFVFPISDNGIGIPPEEGDRVFEISHRAHGNQYSHSGNEACYLQKDRGVTPRPDWGRVPADRKGSHLQIKGGKEGAIKPRSQNGKSDRAKDHK